MDEADRKLLLESLELSQENNKMLRAMRRSQKIASFMRLVYWVIIIGASIGAFYVLQPYVDQAQKVIKDSSDTINNIKNVFPQ